MIINRLHILFPAVIALLCCASCYREIDLSDYAEEEGKDLLTLNSFVCPDSTVAAAASRTYFFADVHHNPVYVTDLELHVAINGKDCGLMHFDEGRNLYLSDVKASPGDRVTLSTEFLGKEVRAEDVMPAVTPIVSVAVERRGPMQVYYERDFIVTYKITFTDDPAVDNYYFLSLKAPDRRFSPNLGTLDYTHELVFQKLADRLHSTMPGWTPYSPYGLPFSDQGIEGKTHTLVLEEVMQDTPRGHLALAETMIREVRLYSISKAYYDYAVSCIANGGDDEGLQGGMIDLGIAEPVKIYSNVSGGVGILGCYATDSRRLDVIGELGPFEYH